jgi:hypothetical protein
MRQALQDLDSNNHRLLSGDLLFLELLGLSTAVMLKGPSRSIRIVNAKSAMEITSVGRQDRKCVGKTP